MGDNATPRRPAGLKARGRTFWDRVTAEYVLSVSELQLLTEAARALDVLEDLARRARAPDIADDARLRLLRELRGQRAAAHRLLAGLGLPDEDDRTLDSPKTARARKAANTRWGRFRALECGDGGSA